MRPSPAPWLLLGLCLLAAACAGPTLGTPIYGNGDAEVIHFFAPDGCRVAQGTPYPLDVSLSVTDGSTQCASCVGLLYCGGDSGSVHCSSTATPVGLSQIEASCDDGACSVSLGADQQLVITMSAPSGRLRVKVTGVDPLTSQPTSWDDSLLIDTRKLPSWEFCE